MSDGRMHSLKRWVVVALVAGLLACGGASETTVPDPVRVAEDQRIEGAQVLLAALARGPTERRVRAAVAMGRIQSVSYADALAAASRDPDIDVRRAALFALGQLGLPKGASVPETAVKACREATRDSDAAVAAVATEALGKLAADDAATVLVPLLKHDAPAVRAEAALALFRLRFVPLWRERVDETPELPRAAAEALIEATADADPEVRRAAVYACSRYGQDGAGAALAARIDDGDEWTRLFAVRAIANGEAVAVADRVVGAVRDESPRVRTEAVAALGALGRQDLIPPGALEDDSFHVRTAVAVAFGGAEDTASMDSLRRLERDPSSTVQQAAIDALARRLGGAYRESLERHGHDPDWRLRSAATRASIHLDTERLEFLRPLLKDEDPRVRTAAIDALEGLEGIEVELRRALATSDLAVRGTAVSSLSERTHPDKLGWLRAAYDDSAGVEWDEVREGIVDALVNVPEADDLLTRIATTDRAFSVRDEAIRALRERGREAPANPDRGVSVSEPSPFLGRLPDDEPVVVLRTSKGTVEIRCLTREAPVHVAGFLERVDEGFYDGLIWHRVVPNFVIQGGDPRGDGWGGPGYSLRDEINGRRFDRGMVGMPKAGKDTGGCQIFITHVPTPHLDGNYTIFGRVVAGLDVVDRIEVGDRIERAWQKR